MVEERILNMVSLLENQDHPDAERARELNDLRRLALYELLKEKEERIIDRGTNRRKPIVSRPGIKNIHVYDDVEELKQLLMKFGDPT